VLTTRETARLLSSIADHQQLAELTQALGFDAALAMDRATARRLGLAASDRAPRVCVGRGNLRCLLLQVADASELRARVPQLCRTLAREAPDRLWLLIARSGDGHLCVAAAPPDARGPTPVLLVDPRAVRESDAETFAALVGAVGGSDLMLHLRWRETLGRTALTHRFYRELEERVQALAHSAIGDAPAAARRTIALLHTSRLLFVSFLEARGWLDADREFLRRHLGERSGGRGVHRRFLEPLWFGTLNTPTTHRAPAARAFGRVPFLNGGLFTRAPIERRHRDLRFSDDAIAEIVGGLLARYRLTARESSASWSDAAVDPEMLGRAFESLMQEDTRRARGAFYTPPTLVSQLGRDGLAAALDGVTDAGALIALDDVRVLDPACGSGAFLVFALEALAERRANAGDTRPLAERRRHVLTRNVFGVDVDPVAVWLCQLRLWLSVVVEEESDRSLAPLPNIDWNIRHGDALAGLGFADAPVGFDPGMQRLRLRYARSSGASKRTFTKLLAKAERARAHDAAIARIAQLTRQRRDLLLTARSPDLFARTRHVNPSTRRALDELRAALRRARSDLAALRAGGALPFSFATHFPDVATAGGFSLVLGNPPWVRTREIPREQREALRERFSVFRSAAWEAGAAAAAAGRGFASQVDLAALFTERAVQLVRPGGAVALLLPAKLWGSLAGGGLRTLLARDAPPLRLEDWSGSSAGFDAVVYPSALVAKRCASHAAPTLVRATVHRHDQPLTWDIPRDCLALDASAGAPWLLLPAEVRAAFDHLARRGTPLASSPLGRPLLGVKSGCNEAFVISASQPSTIERSLLRPLVRGEDVAAWRTAHASAAACLLWTHDARGDALAELPPGAKRHLLPFRRQLEQRSDARGARWWSLFRTDAARADRARVVWADIGQAPRALVLPIGDATVPLNTCYVVRTPTEDDAFALATILNSAVGAAWLSALAEPARGGYRRFLGWTCARFPLPADWSRARERLAPIGRSATAGSVPDAWTLCSAVLDAYGVTHAELSPLLSWQAL
jgi:hypothetical protein